MKKIFFSLLLTIPFVCFSQKIITSDIANFWKAYDLIRKETDSAKQLNLINELYIKKGTPGLDAIMRARRYTAEEYVYAINHYPKFWESVRANTMKANSFSKQIEKGVKKLKNIYSNLKPVNTYFEIGVLRTGGTALDGMLLIGSEIALTDKSVNTSEIDQRYPHLRTYFNSNPINDVVFLNVHEYIHTQQKETIGNTLLAQTVIEGVGEFLAEIALNTKSPNPQIDFGFKNEEKIKAEYKKEIFSPNIYNWIWNNTNNPFAMRDLGYFVGYAICKKYYEMATDKKMAVKEMIELDCNNETALIKFVEKTNYLGQKLKMEKDEFEKKRPLVTEVSGIGTQIRNVNPQTKIFTLIFSEEMNPNFSNFEYGPLGENNLLRISKVIGFAPDGKSFQFEADLEPGKQYQLVVNFGFRSKDNYPLMPYLIDFTTSN